VLTGRATSRVADTTRPAVDTTAPRAGRLDAESQLWVDRLKTPGSDRDAAVAALHALLLKAARFEVDRRRATLPDLRGHECDDLAQQSADDAVLAVLAKLDTFRGDSRFTTWAYKFALLEAAVKLRRRSWQGREVQLEPAGWALIPHGDASPQEALETSELLRCLREAIERDLSPHQREILVAVAIDGVPIDVLAERLTTTRGALYKTIHDARAKLRSALGDRGLPVGRDTEAPSP
jgi:RNA polymerase sigma-70 factor, ECF subfamily